VKQFNDLISGRGQQRKNTLVQNLDQVQKTNLNQVQNPISYYLRGTCTLPETWHYIFLLQSTLGSLYVRVHKNPDPCWWKRYRSHAKVSWWL